MVAEITTIAATIGAILGILNFWIWWSERKPEIKVEVASVTSKVYQGDYFIDIELLVHNISEKLTSVYRIAFEAEYFFKEQKIYDYLEPQFITAHSSRRLKSSFQCKKQPTNEIEIKITLYHTHGEYEISGKYSVEKLVITREI